MNITGSKRSDALRRLEALLSSAPVVLFEVDRDGVFVRSEGRGLQALGLASNEVLGRSVFDLYADAPRVLDNIRGALGGEMLASVSEVSGLCYEVHYVPLRDHAGAVTGVLGLASDITERKLATDLLEKLDAIVWTADAETLRFTFMSGRARELVGQPVDEWLGRSDFLERILHPDERDTSLGLCRAAAADGKDRHWAHRVITADGRVRWFATTVRVMTASAGPVRELLGLHPTRELLGLMVDITDHLYAEQTLQRSDARLHLMLEQLPAIIWTTDRNLRFTTGVGAGLLRLGLEENVIVGHTLYEYFQTDDPNHPHIQCVRRTIETGVPCSYESRWLERDYHNYVEPMRELGADIIGAIGISLDITERKRAEESLRTAEQELRQAQKMEAIGRLAGGIAHDFNNLLSIIICYCDLLFTQLKPEGVVQNELTQIRQASERAANLTRQLLAFSRRQVLVPRVIDLNAVTASVTKMFARVIGEDIRVTVNAAPSLGRIKADPSQIEQVIMNLVVNARDALPEGGELTIETADAGLDETYAREHVGVQPGDYVMLVVRDTGVGMDDATQSRIFEPFFTTKEVGKGTGLGLSTVFGIVKQSGGHITVESAPGRGTTFRVYLPRTDEAEVAAIEAPAASVRTTAATILLVEDDDSVRELVRTILLESGYDVLAARGPSEAEATSEQHAGPIHLLLTDVVMPQMSGSDLARRLRAQRPRMRTLFMSGYVDHAIAEAGESAPAFLPKPFTPAALTRKVHDVLRSG